MRIVLTSNAALIVRRLRHFPATMRAAIAQALDTQLELAVGHIQSTRLSRRGAATLGVVTNRLRSSISRAPAAVSADAVGATIGTNVVYAGVHEFGLTGTVNVRAHTRRSSRLVSPQSARMTPDGRIQRVPAKRKRNGTSHAVRAHTRQVSVPARAPIRTGLEESAPRIGEAVSDAIVRSWEGHS